MLQMTITKDSFNVETDNLQQDFDAMQEILANANHLVHFDAVAQSLEEHPGAVKYFFYAKSFHEIVLNLWLNDFNLMFPIFDSLLEEMECFRLRRKNMAEHICGFLIGGTIGVQ